MLIETDSEKILVVDDTPANLSLLQDILEKKGFDVRCALSGQWALQAIERERPDLILLDIAMPEMDGFELCSKLKNEEATRDVPVIFISARSGNEDKIRGFELGAADYITKPFFEAEILARIRTQLDGARYQAELKELNNALLHKVEDRTKQLIKSEHRFRAAADTANDAIVSINVDGLVVSWNRSAERIFGYKEDGIVGQAWRSLFIQQHPDINDPLIEAAATSDKSQDHYIPREFIALSKGGKHIPVEITLSTWLAGGERFFTAIVRDITERKKAEEILKEALIRAESASKTKSQFLEIMSHELQTPLNAIVGLSEVMTSRRDRPGEFSYEELAKHIYSAGINLSKLLADILELSNVETGNTPVNSVELKLSEVLEDCRMMFEPKALESGLKYKVSIADSLPALRADRVRVKQILMNLIGNAIKFTQEGGAITVKAETNDTGGIMLTVSDTGIGIAAEDIPLAMEKFVQIDRGGEKNPHEGSGLGLALSKAFAELHGGTLSIKSELGVGTDVCVSFPPDLSVASPKTESLNSIGHS